MLLLCVVSAWEVLGFEYWLWLLLRQYHINSIPAEQSLVITYRISLLPFLGPSCLFTSLKLVFTVMTLFLFPLLEYLVSCIRKEGEHDSTESPGLSPLFQDWCAGKKELFKPLQSVSAANPSACLMCQVLDEMFLLENYCFTGLLPPSFLPPSLPACDLW